MDGPYYIDFDLASSESLSVAPSGGRMPLFYSVAIRRRGRRGWTFRLRFYNRQYLDALVAALNNPQPLEVAA